MNRSIILFVLVAFLYSCTSEVEKLKDEERRKLDEYLRIKDITVAPTSSGLYYVDSIVGSGQSPELDDVIEYSYSITLINTKLVETSDLVLATKYKLESKVIYGGPFRIALNKYTHLSGMLEGLKLMKEGGYASFIMPSHLAFGEQYTNLIPSFSTLVAKVHLLRVMKDPAAEAQKDLMDILEEYSINPADSINGIYYLPIDQLDTSLFENGDTVDFHYTAMLKDSTIFSQSKSDQPLSIIIGNAGNINGIDRALKLMAPGCKAIVVLPYYYANGANGAWNYVNGTSQMVVPPYSPQVLDIEIPIQ